jgi:hypothetical protein
MTMKKIWISLILLTVIIATSTGGCKKSGTNCCTPPGPGPDTTTVNPQVDPALANTIGFFMDDWQPKNFTKPASATDAVIPNSSDVTVTIDRSNVITKIPRSILGDNSNTWMTQIVSEPVLMDHISTLQPHIIRFPGGSISDLFFWNSLNNQPPADAPAELLAANGSASAPFYWYGKNSESWTLSVDNYYQLRQQTGSEGIIIINYGYARYGTGPNPVAAAAHLAADWVRYDNGRTKYWEIGNENFGDWEAGYRIKTADNKDGQPEFATGQLYGTHFKVFADSMRQAAQEIGKTIKIGAVLYDQAPQSWMTQTTQQWNTGVLNASGTSPDFYIVHNYYTDYHTNANAITILNTPTNVTGTMMNFIKQSLANAGRAEKPIAMTEFNIFSTGSKQQVSHINGLHGVMVLGEALKNKFGLVARWDLSNAWENGDDHGLFSKGDEPDAIPKWTPRPAFYHLYFFKKHLGDRLISSSSTHQDVLSYASSYTSGETAVTLINRSAAQRQVEIKVQNFKKGARYYWYTIVGGGDNGEFSRKAVVNGQGPTLAAGGPAGYKNIVPYGASTANGIKVNVPAKGAVYLVVEKQ